MDEVLYDDSYQLDDSAIPEQGQNQLPAPGAYRVKATSVGRAQKFDKTGPEVITDKAGNEWPTLQINRVDILDGGTGSAAPFQKIKTVPYQVKGKAGVLTAGHVFVLRSLDRSAITGLTLKDAVTEVENRLKGGDPFTVKFGYTATDSDWAKAQIEQIAKPTEALETPAADRTEEQKTAVNEYFTATRKVWNEAKLTTRDFKNPDGTYRQETPSKDGSKQLKARLVISSFVASNEEIELGPYKQ